MAFIDSVSISDGNDKLFSIDDKKERKRPYEYTSTLTENEDQSFKDDCDAKKKKTDEGNDNSNNGDKSSNDTIMDEDKEVFALLVSNVPFQWTYEQITDYIHEHGIEMYALEQLEGGSLETGQSVRLLFLNFEKCNQARKQLKLKGLDGHKLLVAFSVPEESDSDVDTNKTLLVKRPSVSGSRVPSPWKPDLDIWAPDPTGVYGLKLEFLESLAIAPPLDKWVHVSNFRCDKSELREVMELAGHVVFCAVVTVSNRYARVMYGHPLEAVQAVSMLNGQIFYGQVLKVSMYKCQNNEIILPKGLPKVGSGFGVNGRPLRDVVRQYERYVCGKNSSINASIFTDPFGATTDNGGCENLNEQDNIGTLETIGKTDAEKMDHNETADPLNKDFEAAEKFIAPKQNVGASQQQLAHQQQANGAAGPNSAAIRPSLTWTASATALPQAYSGNSIASLVQSDSYEPNQMGQSNVEQQYGVPGHYGPVPQYTIHNVDYALMGRQQPRMPHPCQIHVPRYQAPVVYNPYQGVRNPAPVPPVLPLLPGANDWGNPNPNVSNPIPVTIRVSDRSLQGAGDQHKIKAFSAVELSNLPLTTTFPLLSDKMAQVGQVISLELTRPGCALVRFASTEHAERCYQHFNRMCVMGNTIDVKFV